MMAPFPASSVVDKRQVAICLRLKGETADDEFADDLRLRDIELVIAQVCYGQADSWNSGGYRQNQTGTIAK